MDWKKVIYRLLPAALFLGGLLTLQAMVLAPAAEAGQRQFADRVNLTLRLAADRLLDLAGDTTSAIPPVEVVSHNEFLLHLNRPFDYDSLPPFLTRALALHGVEEDYYVAVTDCLNDELMLGYSAAGLAAGEAPCGGREQTAECYNLRLTFPGLPAGPPSAWGWWLAAGLFSLAVLPLLVFSRRRPKPQPVPTRTTAVDPGQPTTTDVLHLGHSAFDPANLLLVVNGIRRPLTYREAKLLHFFCRHPNQVLERQAILKAVWEDEGVIVGRSLDVFVSRLRKLLQKEPAVRISSVHGVGYRFEVDAEHLKSQILPLKS